MEENKNFIIGKTEVTQTFCMIIIVTNNLLWLIIGFKLISIFLELQQNLNTVNNLFNMFMGV